MAWNVDPNPYIRDVFDSLSEAEQNYIRRHPTPKLIERTLCWLNDLSVSHGFVDTPDPLGLLNDDGTFKWYKYKSTGEPVEFVPSLESPFELTESDLRVKNFWDNLRKAITFTSERTLWSSDNDFAFILPNSPSFQPDFRWGADSGNSWHIGAWPSITSTEKPLPWMQFEEHDLGAGKPSRDWHNWHLPPVSDDSGYWYSYGLPVTNRYTASALYFGVTTRIQQFFRNIDGWTAADLSQINDHAWDVFQQEVATSDMTGGASSVYGWSPCLSQFVLQAVSAIYSGISADAIYQFRVSYGMLPLHLVSSTGTGTPDTPIAPKIFVGAEEFYWRNLAEIVYRDFVQGASDLYLELSPLYESLDFYYKYLTAEEAEGSDLQANLLTDPGTQYGSISLTGLGSYTGTGPYNWPPDPPVTLSPPQGLDATAIWEDTPPEWARYVVYQMRPDPVMPPKMDVSGVLANLPASGKSSQQINGSHNPTFDGRPFWQFGISGRNVLFSTEGLYGPGTIGQLPWKMLPYQGL